MPWLGVNSDILVNRLATLHLHYSTPTFLILCMLQRVLADTMGF